MRGYPRIMCTYNSPTPSWVKLPLSPRGLIILRKEAQQSGWLGQGGIGWGEVEWGRVALMGMRRTTSPRARLGGLQVGGSATALQ